MEEQVAHKLRLIFLHHFKIMEKNFDWHKPMIELQPNFKLLAYLKELEQQIGKIMEKDIVLLGKINVLIHTPEDILRQIHG
ncbi:MAG: hypothetical protein AB8G22_16560 [Saprospiraceae bacterium]